MPPVDPEAVASMIAHLLAEPEIRRRMGDAGRARVRDRFSQDRLLGDIRGLYAELTASTRVGRR